MINNQTFHLYLTILIVIFLLNTEATWGQDVTLKSSDGDYTVGIINRMDLLTDYYGDQFRKEYAAYEPDNEALAKLKNHIYKVNIIIVTAFWCSDSRRQVPRFYKILDLLRYDYKEIQIISVNMEKQAGEMDISGLDIERVPTFIFYVDSGESGRIIETPTETIERDMLMILSE